MIALILLGLFTFPLASCHTTSSSSATSQTGSPPSVSVTEPAVLTSQSVPLPVGTDAVVRRAEEIGRAIFEQDAISAKATDALIREFTAQIEERVRGWVTLKEEGFWLVRFIGRTENQDGPYAAYDVKLPTGHPSNGEVIRLDPPQRLVAEQLAMYRARQAAIQAVPGRGRCAKYYNSVILPGNIAYADGWVVYLLAATRTPGEIKIGGHFRVELSTTGTEVKQVLPLSKTCLRLLSSDEPGSRTVEVITNHVISDTPIETHVYLSLLHRKPFAVVTDVGLWEVAEGRISFSRSR